VVKDLLSVNLSKDYTHYNWGLRPIGACVHSWRVRACVRACVRLGCLAGGLSLTHGSCATQQQTWRLSDTHLKT
jgi:hypothetical protein